MIELETTVKVLLKSVNPDNQVMTTFEIIGPQVVMPQALRHRLSSWSILSLRAMSTKRVIDDYLYRPKDVRYEERGMVGATKLTDEDYNKYIEWYDNLHETIIDHIIDCPVPVHSQLLSRPLQMFRFSRAIMTVNNFGLENFFSLRKEHTSQPDIIELSNKMEYAYNTTQAQELNFGAWHIPLLTDSEVEYSTIDKVRISACRTARTSYGLYTESKPFTKEQELAFADKLLKDKHMSPLEHQVVAMPTLEVKSFTIAPLVYTNVFRNCLYGYMQYRSFAENGIDINETPEHIYNTIAQLYKER